VIWGQGDDPGFSFFLNLGILGVNGQNGGCHNVFTSQGVML
jgi:hypothetical protein